MTQQEKLEVRLKEALSSRERLTNKKDEIRWLNYYVDEFMLILEPIQRVAIGIKFNEFLSELDRTKGHKSSKKLANKFLKELQK